MTEYAVFLSYKSSDRAIAETLEHELRPYAPDLRFFFAPTKVTEGEPWRDRLLEEIRNSDSLFIIYTPAFPRDDDEIRTNDWLLYEAGLKSTPDPDPDPVICFYPQGQAIPKPVEHLQGVEASRESLRRFLDRFLRTTEITQRDRPLNQNVDDTRLEQIATTVSDAFRIASTQRRYVTYHISITLPDAITITADSDDVQIPQQALVNGDAASLDVFGRTEACTWEELTREQVSYEARWLADLDAAFNAVVHGRRPPPVTGTFRDPWGRILRPTLYRADWSDDTLVGVRVLFTEEQAPAYFGGPLFNILRMMERYKDEIFGAFLDDQMESVRRHPERSPRVLERLKAALQAIHDDDKTRHLFSREVIIRSFPEDGDRRTLLELREEWNNLYAELWQQLDASEDGAAKADLVKKSLVELRRNHDETAAITARRYLQLVETRP